MVGGRTGWQLQIMAGLTRTNVALYCPDNATPTVLENMTHALKALRSTQAPDQIIKCPHAKQPTPVAIPSNPANELHVFECAVATLYTDNFGCFPIRAQSRNQYIMVAYHDKANVILIKGFHTNTTDNASRHTVQSCNI